MNCRAHWPDDDFGHRPDLVVYEPELEPIPTGLLDQHGRELFRMPEREPIGFIHDFSRRYRAKSRTA